MKHRTFLRFILLCFFMLMLGGYGVQAQKDSIVQDTTAPRVTREAIKKMGRAEATDTVFSYQLNKLMEYSAKVSEVTFWLQNGFDTVGLQGKIQGLRNDFDYASQGYLEGNKVANHRNLKSSLILIENVLTRLEDLQTKMDGYVGKLFSLQQKLHSFRNDSLMRVIPKDEILTEEYLRRIGEVNKQGVPAARKLKGLALDFGFYQNAIARLQLEASNTRDQIKLSLISFKSQMLVKEQPYLYELKPSKETAIKAITASMKRALITFSVYYNQSWPQRLLIAIIIISFWMLVRSAIRTLRKQNDITVLRLARRWVRVPLIPSLFIGFGIGQFFYDDAPAVFIQYMWLVLAILGTLIFYSEFNKKTIAIWGFGLILFLVAGGSNLLIQALPLDRWVMVLLSLTGIAVSAIFLYQYQAGEKTDMPLIRALIILFMAQMAISFFANVMGRYTLAKIMLTGGYFNILNGVILFWMMLLISDFVILMVEWIKDKESFSSYFNLTKIKEGTRPILKTAMIVLWIIVFIKNLNLYSLFKDGLDEALSKTRFLGNFEFTLWSIFTFFVVIYLSFLLSNFVNYVLGNSGKQAIQAGGKSKIGGAVLILRLVIITLGFLLALAAAGIPLDKVTIIIGALGVGIGFGLQNIVNNLVSGIIIAFERPINIGDQIEVGGRLGKVMEIGIRSSKLATFDGADVVIPNGDLLNQHLVNWTLSSNYRRVEALVGVKYGTNLNLVKDLLNQILQHQHGVVSYPEPLVLVNQFGDSSIEFRLLFWTNDIGNWVNLKSNILLQIDEVFKANQIEIPYPQQDIYIKEIKKEI